MSGEIDDKGRQQGLQQRLPAPRGRAASICGHCREGLQVCRPGTFADCSRLAAVEAFAEVICGHSCSPTQRQNRASKSVGLPGRPIRAARHETGRTQTSASAWASKGQPLSARAFHALLFDAPPCRLCSSLHAAAPRRSVHGYAESSPTQCARFRRRSQCFQCSTRSAHATWAARALSASASQHHGLILIALVRARAQGMP